MQWIYGFNNHSSTQNLYYTARGDIVYPAAAVVVVQNIARHEQRHFLEHSDLVSCIKVYIDADGITTVASGEIGLRPAILVWDAETLQLRSVLKGLHRNGIVQLDFSSSGHEVVSIGLDPYHSVAVYKWSTQERIFAARSTPEACHDIRYLDENVFASCGDGHVFFWKRASKGFRRFRGQFGRQASNTQHTVAAFGDHVITGTDTGFLLVWEGRNVVKSVKGHTGAITAMYVVKQSKLPGLVTACTAGKIQVWNNKLEVGATFSAVSVGAIDTALLSITWDMLGSKLLYGTRSCEIYEIDSNDGRNIHSGALVKAHFAHAVRGLAVNLKDPCQFCTVGADKSIRIWNAATNKLTKMALLDTKAMCCAYSPDAQLVVIGLGSGDPKHEERKEGGFLVLSEEDLTIFHQARDSKQAISDVKYSPDGGLIAMASYDRSIYIYSASDYAARARCRGHTGQVMHLDFSTDSQFIMSNCDAGELLFWDADRGEQQDPKGVRATNWETLTCPFAYATQGLWGMYSDGTEVIAVDRSNAGDVIAAVDTFGRLRLVNNPCVPDETNFVQCRGHCAYIANVRYSIDDSVLLTSGSGDGSVCQWAYSTPETEDWNEMKRPEVKHV
jgi:microtubule-associated protein-like 6